MVTVQDIQKKLFVKVEDGYDPEAVDAFLVEIEDTLRKLEQDLAESEEKVQLLADKVREYKQDEEDLKNALVGAQKQARAVVREAEEKAAAIVAEAESAVDSVKSQVLVDQEAQLAAVTARVAEEKAELQETVAQVSAFKNALFEMYKEHLEMIAQLPESVDDLAPAAEAEAPAEETPAAEAPAAESEAAEAEEIQEDPFEEADNSGAFESRRADTRKRF